MSDTITLKLVEHGERTIEVDRLAYEQAKRDEEAAEFALAVDIDWTVNASVLTSEDHRAVPSDVAKAIRMELGFECRSTCYSGGITTCRVQCNTCGAAWGEDDGDEWLDAKTAVESARDHECEPDVVIRLPSGDRWFYPYELQDDGTPRAEQKSKDVA